MYVLGCKDKEKKVEPKEKYFPVLSYIQSQVADVDTSVYSIMRIVFVDTSRKDTTYLKREEFADAARDFLSLPDLAKPEYHDRFKEENNYDETLGRVMMIYSPVKISEEVIQREEILIKPGPPDQVSSIFITTSQNNKDSSIEKKMLWNVDQSFQVTTIKQYPGQPEITSTIKVSWNESEQ